VEDGRGPSHDDELDAAGTEGGDELSQISRLGV
jgi:hypothetical protein